jgi:hypothetical protein
MTTTQQEVPNEYKVLEKGMTIAGHTVLRLKRLTERVVGDTYASWIVLCETTDPKSYHKWVTWIAYANETGFHAESGHYFQADEWEMAVGSYDRRGGW